MHYLLFIFWEHHAFFFCHAPHVKSCHQYKNEQRAYIINTRLVSCCSAGDSDTWQGRSRNSGTSSPWCKTANQMPACASILHVWQLYRKSSNRPGKCAREHNWQRSSGWLFQCYIIDSLQTLTCTQGTNNVTNFSCYCLNCPQLKLYFLPGLIRKVQRNTVKLIYSR